MYKFHELCQLQRSAEARLGEKSFCNAKASHIFSTEKNIGIFEKLTSENLTKR